MKQHVYFQRDGRLTSKTLPDPRDVISEGIAWGEYFCLFTPAYWVSQVWMNRSETQSRSPYSSTGTLAEEIVFCMLSGFGITAELAGAASLACRESGLIDQMNVNPEAWSRVLLTPMSIGSKTIRYRYPNQKSKFLAHAMSLLREDRIDASSGKALRDSLLKINGCGLKTAGFVTRNYLDSDEVAILDIHIVRAGFLFGLFSEDDKVEKSYLQMEAKYIGFCRAVEVRPAVLDCVIWDQMRTLGPCALDAVQYKLGQPVRRREAMRKPAQLALEL